MADLYGYLTDLYVAHDKWVAVIQLSLAMLGMGATLTARDFRDVLIEPRAVTIGSAIQLIAVPVTAFLFMKALGVADGLAVGIALIAAVPGGTVSNIFTFLARGNAALSVSITALTTLACLVTTPLILSLLISQYLPEDFTMPRGHIMKEIALYLLLPLIIGMIYLHYLPRSAPTLSKWSIRGSLLGILVIVIGSIMAGRLNMTAFGYGNVLIVVLFAVVLVLPAYLLPRLLRLSRPDITAILFEVNMRNINLGIMISLSIFPAAVASTAQLGNTVLLTLILFGFLQIGAAAPVIALCRRAAGSVAKAVKAGQ